MKRYICRLAHYAALDTLGHVGTAVRSLLYLVTYAAFAQPRASFWRLYAVVLCLVYCCTGVAYFLSQVGCSLFVISVGIFSF